MAKCWGFKLNDIYQFLTEMFQQDIHAKRVYSLANATLGVMVSGALAIHAIGLGLAQARGLIPKHAIKQVDRLLSNAEIHLWTYFAYWVPHIVGQRKAILVALDWTDYSPDGQATIALHLITSHGRATPLLWKTVQQSTLKGRRNDYEDELLVRFHEVLPPDIQVTVLADRGFGDHELLEFLLNRLGFGYVIRIRSNIHVTSADGETHSTGMAGRGRPSENPSPRPHHDGKTPGGDGRVCPG